MVKILICKLTLHGSGLKWAGWLVWLRQQRCCWSVPSSHCRARYENTSAAPLALVKEECRPFSQPRLPTGRGACAHPTLQTRSEEAINARRGAHRVELCLCRSCGFRQGRCWRPSARGCKRGPRTSSCRFLPPPTRSPSHPPSMQSPPKAPRCCRSCLRLVFLSVHVYV